jgi:NAD(P)-dependent dehydrogenase (short-subunit alcohol dehydrogenase family)
MKIEGAVVFVTGANRGLGLEFARQALARGASKVYAGARDPSTVTLPGVIPIKLNVTKPEEVAAAAAQCQEVTLLINNAGIARIGAFLGEDPVAQLREQLETNLFGILNMSRAFSGILGANGGGALLNILSILSWVSTPTLGTYSVTKSAAWALTNTLRIELKAQHTQVVGFHAGLIDTDLARGFDAPKARPEDVVRASYEAIEAGLEEVAADEGSRLVKQGLSHGVYLQDVMAR